MEEFKKIIIAPSFLAADWSIMKEEIKRAENSGADWIHLDVMDGHFVDNISFGPQFVSNIRSHSKLPLDVHLMITNPDKYIDNFVNAGADRITVHVESQHDVEKTLYHIKKSGCNSGLSIRPETPFESCIPYINNIDLILIMTVVPGFGGQKFMEKETLPKILSAKSYRDENNLNYHIQVDGGINQKTSKIATSSGANVLVSGTSLYGVRNMKEAIEEMRNN